MTTPKASAVDNSRIDTNSKAVSDAMSDDHLRESFERAMMEQKSTRIHITGRHNIVNSKSSSEEVLDFDFRAEIGGFVDLNVIEITTSPMSTEVHVMIAREDQEIEEDLVERATEKLKDISLSKCESLMFGNKITKRENMARNLQISANFAQYGGRVQFEHENLTELPPRTPMQRPVPDTPGVEILLVWKYKSWIRPKAPGQTRHALPAHPNLHPGPRPTTWNYRIQHAMVDGQHGLITLEDEFVRVAPMMKAVRKYALHEHLTMLGHFGTSRIHKWGLDEPNEEPAYVGRSHFGGGGIQSVARHG
ncbi:hypothetical protein D6D21_09334 [Aureobasidium pullulans]|uniref:Uncharacterized protein n=1 Tax=Aureobasidium pullulans TaxID=5580 RepID=A0AB74IL95_AURPU|nr:hypothetical protein D6D21_09334 [Aureobasidium pullulans]